MLLILACGPKQLVKEVRKYAKQFSNNGIVFEFHSETFKFWYIFTLKYLYFIIYKYLNDLQSKFEKIFINLFI